MFIVGIGGKIGTGKTSVAHYLSILYDGHVLPIAGSLKGLYLSVLGVNVFFPQKDVSARRALQEYGSAGRSISPSLWVSTLLSYFSSSDGSFKPTFIPDIRYPDEISFLREKVGKERVFSVYLSHPLKEMNLPTEVTEHESEKTPPNIFDLVVTDPTFEEKIVRIVEFLGERGYQPSPRKPRIYIGSNIHGSDDFPFVFTTLKERLEELGYVAVCPDDAEDGTAWMDLVERSVFDDACATLVANTFNILSQCDGGVFYLPKPSIGAAMEIFALALQGKPIVIATPLSLFYHPWLRTFGKVVWETDTVNFTTTLQVLRDRLPPTYGEVVLKVCSRHRS